MITEEDVTLVADILDDDIDCAVWCTGCDSTSAARRVLAALAKAGRLNPADAATSETAVRERVAAYLERVGESKRRNALDTVAPEFGEIERMALRQAAEWCRDETIWNTEREEARDA